MAFKYVVPDHFAIELCGNTDDRRVVRDAHFHDCYELYYLSGGTITYFVDNTIYTLQKGDLVLIPPHTIHKTQTEPVPNHKRILIYLTEDFIRDYVTQRPALLSCFHTHFLRMDKARKHKAEILLEQLLTEQDAVSGPDDMMIKALLIQLLILMNRQVESARFEMKFQPDDALSNKVLDVVRFINANYFEDISLQVLASRFYMNPSYLSRIFKKVIGLSYSDYLSRVRMKHAASLLLNSEKTVTEIGLQVGFNSSNHFCKAFKAIMGVSPLKYRKVM